MGFGLLSVLGYVHLYNEGDFSVKEEPNVGGEGSTLVQRHCWSIKVSFFRSFVRSLEKTSNKTYQAPLQDVEDLRIRSFKT